MVMNCIQHQDLDAFTASTRMIDLTGGRYLHQLHLYMRAEADSGNEITPKALLGLINPIEVFLKGSPVISISAEDLYALNALAFGHYPELYEGDAATDDGSYVSALRIPMWQPPRVSGELKYRLNRVAVTNADTETVSLSEWSSTRILNPKYLHYVTLPGTSAAATGFGNRVELGRTIGELEGILLRSATVPTDTTETATTDNVKIFANEVEIINESWLTAAGFSNSGFQPGISADTDDITHNQIVSHYRWVDLSEDPVPRGANVRMDIDTEAVGTAFRITPVYAI